MEDRRQNDGEMLRLLGQIEGKLDYATDVGRDNSAKIDKINEILEPRIQKLEIGQRGMKVAGLIIAGVVGFFSNFHKVFGA